MWNKVVVACLNHTGICLGSSKITNTMRQCYGPDLNWAPPEHNSVGATASTEVLVIQPSPGEILNEYFIVQVFTSVVVPRYNSG